ncbi:hypothetical protein L2E82_14909 [Cichorium intybus]|uniref:Uncharacterized protein n=1 Tax=Cichorium intybus TaxID=13427 RepID=A0ACB9F2K0_CICIN|nr:hypothetical protein L2E82_14909 [Cichorium intybus]
MDCWRRLATRPRVWSRLEDCMLRDSTKCLVTTRRLQPSRLDQGGRRVAIAAVGKNHWNHDLKVKNPCSKFCPEKMMNSACLKMISYLSWFRNLQIQATLQFATSILVSDFVNHQNSYPPASSRTLPSLLGTLRRVLSFYSSNICSLLPQVPIFLF